MFDAQQVSLKSIQITFHFLPSGNEVSLKSYSIMLSEKHNGFQLIRLLVNKFTLLTKYKITPLLA